MSEELYYIDYSSISVFNNFLYNHESILSIYAIILFYHAGQYAFLAGIFTFLAGIFTFFPCKV